MAENLGGIVKFASLNEADKKEFKRIRFLFPSHALQAG